MAQGPWRVLEFRLPERNSDVVSTTALYPPMFMTHFNNDGVRLTPRRGMCDIATTFNGYAITHFLETNEDQCFRNEYSFSYI